MVIGEGFHSLQKMKKHVQDGKDGKMGKMETEIDVSFSYAYFNSGAPLVIDLYFHF
jgi:hypothetical protein